MEKILTIRKKEIPIFYSEFDFNQTDAENCAANKWNGAHYEAYHAKQVVDFMEIIMDNPAFIHEKDVAGKYPIELFVKNEKYMNSPISYVNIKGFTNLSYDLCNNIHKNYIAAIFQFHADNGFDFDKNAPWIIYYLIRCYRAYEAWRLAELMKFNFVLKETRASSQAYGNYAKPEVDETEWPHEVATKLYQPVLAKYLKRIFDRKQIKPIAAKQDVVVSQSIPESTMEVGILFDN